MSAMLWMGGGPNGSPFSCLRVLDWRARGSGRGGPLHARIRAGVHVTVKLDIGRKDDLRKLSYEVDALGFFRWRIWSGKEYLARGWWRVDVVYESNEPVMCGGGRKPCSYSIEVR